MKKTHLAVSLALLLAACSSEPRPEPISLDYSHLGKIYLNTQDLRVIDKSYGLPQRAPYITKMFKPTLAEAMNRWAKDRMQAAGAQGQTVVIIKEATLTEQDLPMETGISAWFTRQQAKKYTARVEMDINARTPVDNRSGMVTAHALRTATIPEDATDYEKYEAYTSILSGIMADLDKSVEKGMKDHMAGFIASGPGAQMSAPQFEAADPTSPAVDMSAPQATDAGAAEMPAPVPPALQK